MNHIDIAKCCDHTLLKVDCTWEEIKQILKDAYEYNTASVCIPPSFIKQARGYCEKSVRLCTVIGFPNGYSTSEVKWFEAADAIRNGADEIDMVVNITWVKDKKWKELEDEIRLVKSACGNKILKVIIETCLLTDEEKKKMCSIVSNAGADFIKTSTGFSTGGATREDVKLLRDNVAPNVQVKASGGIKTFEDADYFIALGATRLGTSKIVKLLKEENK